MSKTISHTEFAKCVKQLKTAINERFNRIQTLQTEIEILERFLNRGLMNLLVAQQVSFSSEEGDGEIELPLEIQHLLGEEK